MEPQAKAPEKSQAPAPVHPIHQEEATHQRLTEWVKNNPDNDPHSGTDMEEPKAPPQEEKAEEPKAEEAPAEETVEYDEDTPFFELEHNGKKEKLSAKQLREGYLAKQDYHRNIQKVKAEQAELQTKVQQAELKAAQDYVQKLELHKQAVAKLAGVKTMQEIEALSRQDPAAAQQEFLRVISVNQTLQQLEGEQRSSVEKLQLAQRSAHAQAVAKARATLEADIPGWNAEMYTKVLGGVAKEYGFQNHEVEPVVDARLIKVFNDAFQYRQLQKAKPEVNKKVVAVPKVPLKPGSAEKPNSSNEVQELQARLKKSGRGEDFVALQLAKQKLQKRK